MAAGVERNRISHCLTKGTYKRELNMILVTGGAGFIGANFVLGWLALNDEPVINLDKFTYSGNP